MFARVLLVPGASTMFCDCTGYVRGTFRGTCVTPPYRNPKTEIRCFCPTTKVQKSALIAGHNLVVLDRFTGGEKCAESRTECRQQV